MSQLSVPPFSRRSPLTGLGAGAAGLGLAACGAPGGGDDDADEPVRDGFRQADVDVPSEYSDRTPILFWAPFTRSEEHTSELQSRGQLVCRLLLEKKKQNET